MVSTPRHEEIMEINNAGLAYSVWVMVREGAQLSDCKQDQYSFRFPIVNIIGKDQQELLNKQTAVKERLKFVFKSLSFHTGNFREYENKSNEVPL